MVGANDRLWKPAAEMQGTGECSVMQLVMQPAKGGGPPESGEDSLTLAVSDNIRLFFHYSCCLHPFAQGKMLILSFRNLWLKMTAMLTDSLINFDAEMFF